MSSRLMLLFAVSGMFIAVWSADQPPPTQLAIVKKTESVTETVAHEVSTKEDGSHQVVSHTSSKSVSNDNIPMDDLWMFGGIQCNLPTDLAPGKYKIVSNEGDVWQVTIDTDDLKYFGIDVESAKLKDIYTIDDDQRRYFFIRQGERLESSLVAEIEMPADHATQQPLKLDVRKAWNQISDSTQELFETAWQATERRLR